ncbi:MAG: hypothetical protein AAF512_01375 [Pseudomonadota bacterium]
MAMTTSNFRHHECIGMDELQALIEQMSKIIDDAAKNEADENLREVEQERDEAQAEVTELTLQNDDLKGRIDRLETELEEAQAMIPR